MHPVNAICLSCFIVFSFLLGFIIAERKFRAKIQWIKGAGLNKNVIYEVLGQVNIFSNVFAVVLRNGKNEDFALRMADFELPKTKFVKIGSDGKFICLCDDQAPILHDGLGKPEDSLKFL